MPCTYVSIVDFEQIFVCWEALELLMKIIVTYKHGGFIE